MVLASGWVLVCSVIFFILTALWKSKVDEMGVDEMGVNLCTIEKEVMEVTFKPDIKW